MLLEKSFLLFLHFFTLLVSARSWQEVFLKFHFTMKSILCKHKTHFEGFKVNCMFYHKKIRTRSSGTTVFSPSKSYKSPHFTLMNASAKVKFILLQFKRNCERDRKMNVFVLLWSKLGKTFRTCLKHSTLFIFIYLYIYFLVKRQIVVSLENYKLGFIKENYPFWVFNKEFEFIKFQLNNYWT